MKSRQILTVLTLALSLQCFATDRLPRSMAALGDSITAAAIASINRDDGSNSLLLPKFFFMLLKFGYSKSIAAFEDRKLSWATGQSKKIDSHYRKLNALLRGSTGEDLLAYNAAVSGDNSTGLALQVEAVTQWSEQNFARNAPDYVLLEIGANDLCTDSVETMTPTPLYLDNVRSALSRLLASNAQSRVLIGGVPNLERLREVAQGSPVAGLPLIKTCQDMWNTHGFCRSFLQESDPAQRALVMERLETYLDGLAQLTDTLNADFGNDRVRFSTAISEYGFSDEEISVDCFHPNLQGQQIISDLMWQDGWWN